MLEYCRKKKTQFYVYVYFSIIPKKKKKKKKKFTRYSSSPSSSIVQKKKNTILCLCLLIPIFATHFVQARFKQVWLPCGLNSCIILYFILLNMAQAHATYGEIERVRFGGYELVPFGPFAWAQPVRAAKWARDVGSTLGSWRRSCTQNFHLKRAFMLWVIVAQSVCPNLILLPYFLFYPKNTADPKLIS